MSAPAHLAIDLGASSGRAIVGVIADTPAQLRLHEVHRFAHHACPTPTGPVWDLTNLWRQILTGLSAGARWCREQQVELRSVGVDTWGVDWALLGPGGELLGLPHCYRDPQNAIASQQVLERLGGFDALYERTGIQLLPFNTIFQLAARHAAEPAMFDAAARLVFLPDLFHYWLSVELSCERTIASTSSMLNVETGDWDRELLSQLGLPTECLPRLDEPGTTLGLLRQEVQTETGAPAAVRVVLPASHDTASAVVAVPAVGDEPWAYLSSGTWSLLGAEVSQPITTSKAREIPFTNELGAEGQVRFLKNIAGLWLIQELQRDLEKSNQSLTFAQLAEQASTAPSGRTLINPDYGEFAEPGDLCGKIARYAAATNQPVPESPGEFARCCLESLALCYGRTLQQLESVLESPISKLHLVGGGVQNQLLNQLTAAVIARPLVTGPVEATAIGNLVMQAIGCGELANVAEARSLVADSFPTEELVIDQLPQAEELGQRFEALIALPQPVTT